METLSWINAIFIVSCGLTAQFQSFECYSTRGLRDGEVFDFIVVGAGAGGGTVAARLAESGKHTVLLIEAGGFPIPELAIPALSPPYLADPAVVKSYPTVSHHNAALASNGVVNHTIGQMLGGSTGVHVMILNRGHPEDYNKWARLTGDDSWNYQNMVKHFKKMENYTGDFPSDQRGFNGPITVSRHRYAPGSDEWLQGGRELYYEVAEPNGPQIISFTPLDLTHKHGRRVSSYYAYIEPMLQSNPNSSHETKKSNLLILINTTAKRIIFEGNRAVGVNFTSNSSIGHARARKEIIVTAGTVDSALLLMRSGVGPESVLDKGHIPPIKYLPVGKNLHDRPSVGLTIVIGNKSAVFDPKTDLTPEAWRIFNELGDGPYTSFGGMSNQAFLASSIIPPEEKNLSWADIQILVYSSNFEGVVGSGVKVSDLKEGETNVRWLILSARPKSKGSVTLNPNDIDDLPVIDYQYLTHPEDARVIVDGIKVMLRLCEETEAFRKIGCRVPNDTLAACRHLTFRSDEYWECYVRQLTAFSYHSVGTCRMGKGPGDPEAVVDSKLRVIGIEGLRVADASIMPFVPNVNTQTPTYAIAEKAAEMILLSWEEGSGSGNASDDLLFQSCDDGSECPIGRIGIFQGSES